MTSNEFDAWYGYHTSRFPEIQGWMAKFPASGTGATRGSVLEAWEKTLARTDLEAAKEASDDLFSGREELPRGFSEHPRTVANLARRKLGAVMPARTIDGQSTVRCQLCEDTGMVRVWQPSSLRNLKACFKASAEPERKHLKTGAVACTCEMGDCCRWLGVRYDPAKHCRIAWMDGIPPEPIFAEQYGEALAWLHSGRAQAQPNYEPDFA